MKTATTDFSRAAQSFYQQWMGRPTKLMRDTIKKRGLSRGDGLKTTMARTLALFDEEHAKPKSKRKRKPELPHVCPKCGDVRADTPEECEARFGYRVISGEKRRQSWCRDCRRGGSAAKRAKEHGAAAASVKAMLRGVS